VANKTSLCSATTYVDNVAKFACHLLLPTSCAVISQYLLAAGPTDGWTDARQFHRPCSAYYVDRTSKLLLVNVSSHTLFYTGFYTVGIFKNHFTTMTTSIVEDSTRRF